MKTTNNTRRDFLKKTSALAAGSLVVPTIVPSSVFGKSAPSNRINVGMIGTGRQAIKVNLRGGFLKLDNCRVMAVNDVDSYRMSLAKKTIEDAYSGSGKSFKGVKSYDDYRDLLDNKDVDAVMVSTTDNWHAPHTIAAAFKGKHVCMEKAFTIAPMHGKAVVEAVKKEGVANRLDSEFRSIRNFNRAVEVVHNNQIGKVKEVIVGVPKELSGEALGPQKTMQVPNDLNYDMWLGTAFPAPYTMQRVHEPGTIDSRPGWLRISDYCNGMITNWGAHLHDIALWGLKKEYEVPVSVEGTGTFDKGLWNTISTFDLKYTFADGLPYRFKTDFPFVRFIGENGWVQAAYSKNGFSASSESLMNYQPGPNDISYADTLSDKADFLQSITTGEPTLEPLEVGYNVYFLTYMGLVAVTLGRKINWDQKAGRFVNDNAANAMLTRPFREKWMDREVIDWMNKFQEYDLS